MGRLFWCPSARWARDEEKSKDCNVLGYTSYFFLNNFNHDPAYQQAWGGGKLSQWTSEQELIQDFVIDYYDVDFNTSHGNGGNGAFADGHVTFMPHSAFVVTSVKSLFFPPTWNISWQTYLYKPITSWPGSGY